MMIPPPADGDDRERWELGEQRYRLLTGKWRKDLEHRVGSMFSKNVITRITPTLNMSRAPYKYAVNQLNTLLLDPPTTSTTSAVDVVALAGPTLWPLRHELQRYTIAMGEGLMRADIRDGRVVYRPVLPFRVEAVTDPGDAYQLVWVRETMVSERPDGGVDVLRETHDARPEAARPFRVERWQPTPESPGGGLWVDEPTYMKGPDEQDRPYVPYRDRAGNQVIPYQIFHYQVGTSTWNPRVWEELVEAQLVAGALGTFLVAGIRDNSYPTRVTIDLDIPIGAINPANGPNPGGAAFVEIEPATIMRFTSSPSAQGTGSVTTLAATMNVGETRLAIASEIEQALQDAGLGPGDEAPAKGVSGTAIHISREALRRSQKTQIPSARIADQRLLALAAKLHNAYIGGDYPEDPAAYSITYHGIPLSTVEVQSAVDRATRLLDARLTTRKRAILEVYPQMSDAEAQALVDEIEGVVSTGGDAEAVREMLVAAAETDDPEERASLLEEVVDALGLAANVRMHEQVQDDSAGEIEDSSMDDSEDSAETDQVHGAQSADVTAVVDSGAAVADTALNGAQVQALVEMLGQVAAGTLSPAAAIEVMTAAYPTIDAAKAKRIIDAQAKIDPPPEQVA